MSVTNNQHLTVDASSNMTPLPSDYVLGDNDVISGRKAECFHHFGNRLFRKMVIDCVTQYDEAPTKQEKTIIIRAIVDRVRESSPMGSFLKHDPFTGCYYELGDRLAVSACLFPSNLFESVICNEDFSHFFRCIINSAKRLLKQSEMHYMINTSRVPRQRQRRDAATSL
jgi:hypothetical protein